MKNEAVGRHDEQTREDSEVKGEADVDGNGGAEGKEDDIARGAVE